MSLKAHLSFFQGGTPDPASSPQGGRGAASKDNLPIWPENLALSVGGKLFTQESQP
jgi:hypothetical protein